MTSITWAGPRCVQEAAAIFGPQNRTQGRCVSNSLRLRDGKIRRMFVASSSCCSVLPYECGSVVRSARYRRVYPGSAPPRRPQHHDTRPQAGRDFRGKNISVRN